MVDDFEYEGSANFNDTPDSVRKKIISLSKKIRVGKQNKHIIGTHEYNQYVKKQLSKGEFGPSRLNGDLQFAQLLADKYAGTGKAEIKNGIWTNCEYIETDTVIGVVVNNKSGAEQVTANFKIHYSQTEGVHIVPSYDSKRKGIKP